MTSYQSPSTNTIYGTQWETLSVISTSTRDLIKTSMCLLGSKASKANHAYTSLLLITQVNMSHLAEESALVIRNHPLIIYYKLPLLASPQKDDIQAYST